MPPKPTAQPSLPLKTIFSSLWRTFKSTFVQTFPPVVECRIVPSSPIAQPSAVSLKKISLRFIAHAGFLFAPVFAAADGLKNSAFAARCPAGIFIDEENRIKFNIRCAENIRFIPAYSGIIAKKNISARADHHAVSFIRKCAVEQKITNRRRLFFPRFSVVL